jgi:hypothetical protein
MAGITWLQYMDLSTRGYSGHGDLDLIQYMLRCWVHMLVALNPNSRLPGPKTPSPL